MHAAAYAAVGDGVREDGTVAKEGEAPGHACLTVEKSSQPLRKRQGHVLFMMGQREQLRARKSSITFILKLYPNHTVCPLLLSTDMTSHCASSVWASSQHIFQPSFISQNEPHKQVLSCPRDTAAAHLQACLINYARFCLFLPCAAGEGPSHEDKEETVLDFEKEDGSTVQERELHIFALPLYWNPDVPPEENLVFLPVSRFNEDGRIREGWQGKVKCAEDRPHFCVMI
eukprot:scaffold66716_cov20-Tisochrysis_lutea.AAC.1